MRKTKEITALVITTVMLIISGCSGTDTVSEAPSASPTVTKAPVTNKTTSPDYGGEFSIAMRLPKTLNPLLNEDITVDRVLRLVFEPLTVMNGELKPVVNDRLIKSVDYSSDGMNLLITLRDGLTWSDGESLTAKDLVFSIKTLKELAPENAVYKECVENISTYSAISETGVKITYTFPFSGAKYLLNFPIIPEHYYKNEKSPGSARNMVPIGNGKYEFLDYTPSELLYLQASENPVDGVAPFIDIVKAVIVRDSETEIASFEQGIVDIATTEVSNWGKYSSIANTRVISYDTTYFDFVGFNFLNEALAIKEVREAVSSSLPIKGIIETVYLEHALEAASPINPNSWLYEQNLRKRNFDLDQAAGLLRNAGFIDKGGVLSKIIDTGEEIKTIALEFKILVNEENPERLKIAQYLNENLNSIGMKSEVLAVSFEEFQNRLIEKDFDIAVCGLKMKAVPDLTFLFHSSQIEAGQNYFSFSDAITDSLLAASFQASSDDELKKAMKELQIYLNDELPIISLAFRKSAFLTDKKVNGDVSVSLNSENINFGEWFINTR